VADDLRLVTYRDSVSQSARAGVFLANGDVLDIERGSLLMAGRRLSPNVIDLLALGPELRPILSALARQGAEPVGEVNTDPPPIIPQPRLCAPVPEPNSIRDVPCFLDHVRNGMAAIGVASEADRTLGSIPAYYKGNRRSAVGPLDTVMCPSYAEVVDFELEIAAVIGAPGRNISVADAPEHVAGYTIFNDVSARDRQGTEMRVGLGPAKGKDFDTGNVLGPFLLIDSEFRPDHAHYAVRVDSNTWVEGETTSMHWSSAEIVSYVSESETLYPGDVIGFGTVPRGCGLELGRFPSPGSRVELVVDRLAVLANVFESTAR
jgi:2-keto-4-pentenoate hydratase/2-oxohepta-3-ene-1,7-dioic acid hydratase in catechol pathway